MLLDDDLEKFLSAFGKSNDAGALLSEPRVILPKEDGLFAPEVWRLGRSLQIASALGDAPAEAVAAAQFIADQLHDLRCKPLADQDAWAQAIAWTKMAPAPTRSPPDRERIVGAACLRLRKQGYKVAVGAHGPNIAESSRREIIRRAEALIALLGGVETVTQVLRFMRDANLYHDGMWLFGEVGLNLYDTKRPMIPVGWLLSLALRHLDQPGSARKPEVAWRSLVDLAIDFAAAHDCQRYSQFEGIDLHPSQLHRTLTISTLWREFFTLPQVPPKAVRQIFGSLVMVAGNGDNEQIGFSLKSLIGEILQLLEWSSEDRLTIYRREEVEQALPLLQRLTGGAVTTVNAGYGDPLAAAGRTQDSTLLFACGQDRAFSLPRAFLASAACEFVFGLIWSKLGQRAADVVGKALERAIAEGCRGKAPTVFARHEYYIGGRRYEFDVAARDEDRIVLIETKGKMLTRQSRSGDMFAVFRDYSDSFLRMLSQLVRHEVHLRQGQTPLTSADEATDDLRPIKVAVSPLSYGPVSDKMLSSSLIRSLVGARLTLITPDKANQRTIDAFNERVEGLLADMALIAPKEDGLADLFPYLIDVFWLDLGQLLYILDRANTVWDAFQPLKHVTFSSRDFWTELAHADRGGLTQGKWRQIT